MKIRIKFRKWGAMKFVGHLDMMRFFQKAMRRAHIDICYTEGFSPHQIMSFAAPLGVGITSDGEYLDIEVNASMSGERAVAALNAVMVEGVEILSYMRLPDTAKSAMSVVAAADYRLRFREGCKSPYTLSQWQEAISREFTGQEAFPVQKKTKTSVRAVDLKPLVYAFGVSGQEEAFEFFLTVSTGSVDNVKPELVMAALCERCGITDCSGMLQLHRSEVYARNDDGALIPLEAMGEAVSDHGCPQECRTDVTPEKKETGCGAS